MNTRKFHFLYAALTLITLQDCNATNTPDIDLPDLAVSVYPHLTTALEVQLSAVELMELNENVTEQRFMCVEEMVKDLMQTREARECSNAIIVPQALANSVIDVSPAESGWGDDNEEESGSGIGIEFASKVFCDDACQSVFLRAYKDCELLPFKESAELVKDLCKPHKTDEVCFDFVTKFASVSTCTPDKDCADICRLGKEQVLQDSNCCLRYKDSKVTELFSKCELPAVQQCENTVDENSTITDSAAIVTSSTIIFSLSMWVGFLFVR